MLLYILVDPLTTLRGPRLTYRLGGYFYSAALRSSSTTTTSAITYIASRPRLQAVSLPRHTTQTMEFSLPKPPVHTAHLQPTSLRTYQRGRLFVLLRWELILIRGSALHAPLLRCACPFSRPLTKSTTVTSIDILTLISTARHFKEMVDLYLDISFS